VAGGEKEVGLIEHCPQCALQLPEDDEAWLFHGKFYCNPECALKAAHQAAMIEIPKGLPN
jgi:hypothetical protein